MSEFSALFDRATDGIEDPRLEQVVLLMAQRRRARRRGTVAVLTASALVVVIVVAIQVGGGRREGLPPAEAPSFTLSSPAPVTSAPVPGVEKVWPQWDPRDVDDLPAARKGAVPALPAVIAPPSSSPPLSESGVPAAVLAVWQDGVGQVLGTDGDWRSVPLTGRYPSLVLSRDGSQLAVFYSFDSKDADFDYGVIVYDLPTGASRTLPAPAGFEPWDDAGWDFLNEDELLFTSGPSSYVVNAETGKPEEMPISAVMARVSDPARTLHVAADVYETGILTDYAGGSPREMSMERTGLLTSFVADQDTVVGTSYDEGPFSVLVADRETFTPQIVLPILDTDLNYSNWALRPMALIDDGTVLLRVAAIGNRGMSGFRLVLWEPAAGDLSIVSSSDLPIETSVVFASGLLRESGE